MTNSSTTALNVARFIETLCTATGDATMPSQQILMLLALYNYGQISQADLAKHTLVERSSNSRNIAKLGIGEDPVKKPGPGYVESFEDMGDRRNKMVRLTPKGLALMREVIGKN